MNAQGFDLLMFGDTLMEAWRGSYFGEPSERTKGAAEVYHSHFGHKYAAAALGIAGARMLGLLASDPDHVRPCPDGALGPTAPSAAQCDSHAAAS
jgi:hypothetical protein